MNEKKPRNPDVDWGFHATIPRIVRTGYKELTTVQKWLYVCLKDLCGESGTCYRALLVLKEETGLSTGMLSESIQILHKEGLIHAEKKRRSSGGKEVWHITIVDIWQANAKEHPTKRSHSEQTQENVHTVNDNVQQVNDKDEERSAGEPKRSHSETEAVSLSSIITEAVSKRERVVATAPTAPALPSQENSSEDDEDTQPRKAVKTNTNTVQQPPAPTKPKLNTVKPIVPPKHVTKKPITMPGETIPGEALAILDRWDSVHKKPAPRTPKAIQAAVLLMVCDPTAVELKACADWLYTTDRPGHPWYRAHGVHLPDIAENISKWQGLQDAPPDKKASNGHIPPTNDCSGVLAQFGIKPGPPREFTAEELAIIAQVGP
jgi:DNA-binding transcriptional regulator GbsR (MarR family)